MASSVAPAAPCHSRQCHERNDGERGIEDRDDQRCRSQRQQVDMRQPARAEPVDEQSDQDRGDHLADRVYGKARGVQGERPSLGFGKVNLVKVEAGDDERWSKHGRHRQQEPGVAD